MPTPLELLLDPLMLSVLAIFAGLALWEALAPARELPRVRGWRTKGLLAFTGYLAISSYLPFLWADWLAPLQIADLSSLGTLAGAAIGVGLYELGVWAWHRSLHGSNFLSVFQHANVRTPRWLGVIVQRPESHSWHHARGVHAYNYSDLPLFDIVFGTWHNPRGFAPEQGFHVGASSRYVSLLAGRDVAASNGGVS